MSKNINQLSNSGSTLIEVLVAIVIVGLVITGVMLSISYSVRNSAEARYREAASQLAQDGMEVVVLRREIDPWSTFHGNVGTYCIGSGATTLGSAPPCPNNVLNQNKNFTRYVEITAPSATEVMAKVTVEWFSESSVLQDVEISQTFKERAI